MKNIFLNIKGWIYMFNEIRGKLIVSCQALEDEPLHSSFIIILNLEYLDL